MEIITFKKNKDVWKPFSDTVFFHTHKRKGILLPVSSEVLQGKMCGT